MVDSNKFIIIVQLIVLIASLYLFNRSGRNLLLSLKYFVCCSALRIYVNEVDQKGFKSHWVKYKQSEEENWISYTGYCV